MKKDLSILGKFSTSPRYNPLDITIKGNKPENLSSLASNKLLSIPNSLTFNAEKFSKQSKLVPKTQETVNVSTPRNQSLNYSVTNEPNITICPNHIVPTRERYAYSCTTTNGLHSFITGGMRVNGSKPQYIIPSQQCSTVYQHPRSPLHEPNNPRGALHLHEQPSPKSMDTTISLKSVMVTPPTNNNTTKPTSTCGTPLVPQPSSKDNDSTEHIQDSNVIHILSTSTDKTIITSLDTNSSITPSILTSCSNPTYIELPRNRDPSSSTDGELSAPNLSKQHTIDKPPTIHYYKSSNAPYSIRISNFLENPKSSPSSKSRVLRTKKTS